MLGSRKKAKFLNYNFSTTSTKPLNEVRMGEREIKKVGWRKTQAQFEKKGVEKVQDVRKRKREGKFTKFTKGFVVAIEKL